MNRTDDPDVIEHRLLELAYTTDTPITSTALAYFAPCSVEDAEQILDRLVSRDRIRMEVKDDGSIVYELPNRHKLTPYETPVRAPGPPPAMTLRRSVPLALRGERAASPLLAAGLSLVVPGAGQLYTGNIMSALLWFLLVTAGYTLILPGLFLHLFCIAAAAGSAHRLNSSYTRYALPPGRW